MLGDMQAMKAQAHSIMPGDYMPSKEGFVLDVLITPGAQTIILFDKNGYGVFEFFHPDRWFLIKRSV